MNIDGIEFFDELHGCTHTSKTQKITMAECLSNCCPLTIIRDAVKKEKIQCMQYNYVHYIQSI